MKLSPVYTALSDPTRRAILRLLRTKSLAAGAIADEFHLSKATISHHFKILKLAGLVRSERQGTFVVYPLQSNVLEDTAAELLEIAAAARTPKRSRAT
jgi:ArsR family transcriptional regulator, arsenate/arsenite/antimonite-responsive transcriptional repressor